MPDSLPYGSWPSPLSARDAASASPRFEGAAFVGDEVWWGQSVPEEGGRTSVRCRRGGAIVDVLPAPWSARSRVHEYGGGAWVATAAGTLYFVEKTDQRVWTVPAGGTPQPLTAADAGTRYGGLTIQRGLLLAVRERHGDARVPERDIVRIDPDGAVTSIVAGSTFLAQPALSPGCDLLAWVAWDHPHMPWERSEVRVGRLRDGVVAEWTSITSGETAALQPTWAGPDELLLIDEPTGRWNLWRVDASGARAPRAIAPADADTGGGLWNLGLRWYAPLADGRIVAVRTNGREELTMIDAAGGATRIDLPAAARLSIADTDGSRVLVTGAAPGSAGVWLVTADGAVTPVAGGTDPDAEAMPLARAVTYAGPHGEVHAFDFPPTGSVACGADGELPPYIVHVHGGPTAHVSGVPDSGVAFWTSRGIGVLEVNYGGSTGYGRAYRERLLGRWGIVDVDDVAAAASGLIAERRADPARIAIAGGSAGGWTVLAALVATDVFAAGISRYGVGDLRALAADTHDFEAHYLDGLVGPLPEAESVYLERSPLSHPDRFRVPLLLLQGAEDAVVPPAQAEMIRDALAARGVPHAYVRYEGEGHGFRRAQTIVHAFETELAFLSRVFGFGSPDVAPLDLA